MYLENPVPDWVDDPLRLGLFFRRLSVEVRESSDGDRGSARGEGPAGTRPSSRSRRHMQPIGEGRMRDRTPADQNSVSVRQTHANRRLCGAFNHHRDFLRTHNPDWDGSPLVFFRIAETGANHAVCTVQHKDMATGRNAVIGTVAIPLATALLSPGIECDDWCVMTLGVCARMVLILI